MPGVGEPASFIAGNADFCGQGNIVQEINLYHLLKYYAKHWLIVALFTGAGLGIGITYNTFVQVPLYKSEATLLLISPDTAASPQDTTLINNYIELFKSRRVLQPVIDQEKLNTSYSQFVGSVDATNDKTTQVIRVSITSKSPSRSHASTDAAIKSFRGQVKTLYSTDNVQVVDSASSPNLPYNIHKPIQLLLATAAGFILAVIGLFFVFDFKQDQEHDQPAETPAESKQPQPAPIKPRARKQTTATKPWIARLWKAIATRVREDWSREDWYVPSPEAIETPTPKPRTAKKKTKNKK